MYTNTCEYIYLKNMCSTATLLLVCRHIHIHRNSLVGVNRSEASMRDFVTYIQREIEREREGEREREREREKDREREMQKHEVCVCVYIYMRVCMCMCVCVRALAAGGPLSVLANLSLFYLCGFVSAWIGLGV